MTEPTFILVVDDDENDLALTVAALQARGTAPPVIAVRDGADALDYLQGRGEFKGRPAGTAAFLLLDLNMPRIDGWQVLRQLRDDEALGTIPVVVFTSSKRDSDIEQCYRLGANAYVVKPGTFDEFSQAVQDIEVFWARRNRPPPARRLASLEAPRPVA